MVMERTAGDTGAFGEAIVFLDYFKDLPDPRQRGKVLYPLDEVLLLCLLAVLAGSEAITDIARFGEKKLELLRRFRPFRDGTPSHECDATRKRWRGVSASPVAKLAEPNACSSTIAPRCAIATIHLAAVTCTSGIRSNAGCNRVRS
jgi:DDE_Tnp_1-associated